MPLYNFVEGFCVSGNYLMLGRKFYGVSNTNTNKPDEQIYFATHWHSIGGR